MEKGKVQNTKRTKAELGAELKVLKEEIADLKEHNQDLLTAMEFFER